MQNSDIFKVYTLRDTGSWQVEGEFSFQNQAIQQAEKTVRVSSALEVKVVRESTNASGRVKQTDLFHEVLTRNEDKASVLTPDPLHARVANSHDFLHTEVRVALSRALSELLRDHNWSSADVLFNPVSARQFANHNEALHAAALYKLYVAGRAHDNDNQKNGNARVQAAYFDLIKEADDLQTKLNIRALNLQAAVDVAQRFDPSKDSSRFPIAIVIAMACGDGNYEARLQNAFDFGKAYGSTAIWNHIDPYIAEHLSIKDFLFDLVCPDNMKVSDAILRAIQLIDGHAPGSGNFCWKQSIILAKGLRSEMLPLSKKVAIREVVRMVGGPEPLASTHRDDEIREMKIIQQALVIKSGGYLGGKFMEKALEKRRRLIADRSEIAS